MSAIELSSPELESSARDLRTSSYVIFVDLPDDADRALLLHGYTGAYDRVSRRLLDFVRRLDVGKPMRPLYGQWSEEPMQSQDRWEPPTEVLNALRQRGYLTNLSVADEVEKFSSIANDIHRQQQRSMPAYVIMPTYDCNLRCHYCFQDQFRTNPAYRGLLKSMSTAMADRIMASFDYIESTLHDVPATADRRRRFTLFGGEPLLASSFGVVQHIVAAQKALQGEIQSEFSAVTNGTEIEAYTDILGPLGISKLQITLDGPSVSHDKRRIYADGSPSFSKIAPNIAMALERGVEVSIRVNVDRANFSQIEELAHEIARQRWAESSNFSAYLAPVFDYSGLGNAGSRRDFFNTWELGQMLKELKSRSKESRIFARVDGGLEERVHKIFDRKSQGQPKASFCGAHNGMYIFDAFGDIYACWDRTGDKNLRIGTVNDNTSITMNALGDSWRARNVTSNATCKQCRFALNCGGGCAVLAEGSSGTIHSNFCDAFGKRFRNAVASAYMASSLNDSSTSLALHQSDHANTQIL